MKKCTMCGIEKKVSEFYKKDRNPKFPSQAYRTKCRNCFDIKNLMWRDKNKKKVVRYRNTTYKRVKIEALNRYGKICQCCGVKGEHFLTIDHINGDGAEHRRKIKAVKTQLYGWLKKNNYPKGFQVLCYNCNYAKARNKNVCPHKTLYSFQ